MSLFGDLDVASAADDPYKVEDGTYMATVTKVEAKSKKDDASKKFLLFNYTIVDEDSPMAGRVVPEFKSIPMPDDPANPSAEDARAMSFLKQRLLSLGVPQDEINTVQVEDLIGLDVVIKVKNNKSADGREFTNITSLELADASDSNGDSSAWSYTQ